MKDHVLELFEQAKGVWYDHLAFESIKYWEVSKKLPYKVISKYKRLNQVEYTEFPLPSDSRFRLDCLHMKAHLKDAAQDYKELQEVV